MRHALFLLAPLFTVSALCAQTPYLIDSNLDQLFSVDLNTGAATSIASTANNNLSTPADLAWDAATSTLWTIDLAGGEVGTIDVTNGTFTAVHQTNQSGWQAMAWDPVGQKFYLNNQTNPDLYVLDPATGTTTLIGDTGQGLITAMTIDPSGQLWGMEFSSGALVQIDKTTAAATVIGTGTTNCQGMGFTPNGQLFAVNTTTDSLYSIDTTTGAGTLIGAHGGGVVFAKGFTISGGGPNYATATAYGSGCGAPSTPILGLGSVARPVLGQMATVRTRDIPANSPAGFILLGFSPLNPGIDLTPINMPGCRLYVNSVLIQGLPVLGPTADFSLQIPNSLSLAGQHAYLQTGVIAVGANPLGVLASNGIDWLMDIN